MMSFEAPLIAWRMVERGVLEAIKRYDQNKGVWTQLNKFILEYDLKMCTGGPDDADQQMEDVISSPEYIR